MEVLHNLFRDMLKVLMNKAEKREPHDQDQRSFQCFEDRHNAQPSVVAWIRCIESHSHRKSTQIRSSVEAAGKLYPGSILFPAPATLGFIWLSGCPKK